MFIRTPRLFLRPPWPEDAAAVHAALDDWDIASQLARMPWPYRRADAEAFCAPGPRPARDASLLIWRRTAGEPELAGGFGLSPARDPALHEIGYWIGRPHRRRGYGVEAGRAVLALAFEAFGHTAIGAGHYVDNPASGEVLARLGFAPTGEVLPYPCTARGCEVLSVEYRLTRGAWAAHQGYALAA